MLSGVISLKQDKSRLNEFDDAKFEFLAGNLAQAKQISLKQDRSRSSDEKNEFPIGILAQARQLSL